MPLNGRLANVHHDGESGSTAAEVKQLSYSDNGTVTTKRDAPMYMECMKETFILGATE